MGKVMGGIRRSSRRATIERRVWSSPRKEKATLCGKFQVRGKPHTTTRERSNYRSKLASLKSYTKRKKKLNNEEKNENGFIRNGEILSLIKRKKECKNKESIISENTSLNYHVVDEFVSDNDILHSDDEKLSQSVPSVVYEKSTISAGTNYEITAPINQSSEGATTISKLNFTTAVVDSTQYLSKDHSTSFNLQQDFSSIIPNETVVKGSDLDLSDSNIIQSIGMRYPELEVVKVPSSKDITSKDNNVVQISAKDDDGHVSLSEALAKLVDSEDSNQGIESETVTIHPVLVSESEEVHSRNSLVSLTSSNDSCCTKDETIANALLSLKSGGMDYLDVVSENKCQIHPVSDFLSNGVKENEFVHNVLTNDSENSNSTCSKSPPTKQLPQLPPLVRIPTRPPVIKTPLQCPECPMRFCTVRSLLWHFGAHISKDNNEERKDSSMLLKGLIVNWDKPEIPISNSEYISDSNPDFVYSSLLSSSQSEGASFSLNSVCGKEERAGNDSKENNSCNANGEFILKVPIPKLKHKSYLYQPNSSPPSKKFKTSLNNVHSHYTNILPKLLQKTPSEAVVDQTEQSYNTVASKNSANKSNLTSETPLLENFLKKGLSEVQLSCNSPVASCTSVVRNPVVPCSNASAQTVGISTKVCEMSTQTKPTYLNSNLPKQITVIPVEKLGDIRQKMQDPSFHSKSNLCDKENQKLLEKDGLVMINQNLALRIMSSQIDPSEVSISPLQKEEATATTYCSGESSSNLTILPHSNCSKHISSFKRNDLQTPDILTIVPQTDHDKEMSHCVSSTTPPQILTASGKVTPDSSQVVKLVLLPSKDSKATIPKLNSLPEMNESNPNCHLLNDTIKSNSTLDFDDSEESDDGMVIDVKDETPEGCSMDPLSMCAVTMEDETSQQEKDSKLYSRPTSPSDAGLCDSDDYPLKCKRNQIRVDEEKYQQRKYVCKYCEKRFGWSTDLKRHIILHTGERPFKCKWCPITFTRKFLLQNHIKKIHPSLFRWSDLWE